MLVPKYLRPSQWDELFGKFYNPDGTFKGQTWQVTMKILGGLAVGQPSLPTHPQLRMTFT